MSHTPGPWSATANSTDVFTKKDGVFVAKCYDSILGAGVKECQSNAQLIAAAPDLLEACKALVEKYDDSTNNPLRKQHEIEKAKEVIAKAEGYALAA